MWQLDTSVVVAYLRGDRSLADRIKLHQADLAISAIVLAELHFGALASNRPDENLARLAEFVELIPIVHFDRSAAVRYGEIRNAMRTKGRPVGETDTFIAAVALAHGAAIVTRNRRHFAEIEGIVIEEW